MVATDGVCITIDVDWAPDFIIDELAATLIDTGARATWFVTHASPAIDRLRRIPDRFELGVHPNFQHGSTHGSTPGEVLDHVMTLVPDAVSLRSHGVVSSGAILAEMTRRTPLRIDSTQFLPGMPHIRPVVQRTPSGDLYKIPFFWADDHEMLADEPNWDPPGHMSAPGVKVFLFHPIHVHLNDGTSAAYTACKALFPRLQDATPAPLATLVHTGAGPGRAFRRLCKLQGRESGGGRRLKDFISW